MERAQVELGAESLFGLLAQAPDLEVAEHVRGRLPRHGDVSIHLRNDVVTRLRGVRDHVLDRAVAGLSGGERRRCSLARLLLGEHDLIVLDEPTNHLDVEAVSWLAQHLASRETALVVVTHDRWFLDAVCERTWEVHDGVVDVYDGGYAAFVLAKAERQRQAAASEARRQNLMRKELAWLRRGAPARTSKPKFRIEAANALIDHVRDLIEPTPAGEWRSVCVASDGSYGVPEGLVSSFPVRSDGRGGREIVQGLDWNGFLEQRVAASVRELAEERDLVADLLG